jgi:UDP-2-acetamido-2,6-beta-L-arabino-hexul-4-ose reductase
MKIKIEKLSPYTDIRGFLFEPIGSAEIREQRNCHVVVSRPGAVRGNHCHYEKVETIFVMGPAKVIYRQENATYELMIGLDEVYRLTIPPGVPHAIQNTADFPTTLVVFTTQVHDPDNPDTVEYVLIDDTQAV